MNEQGKMRVVIVDYEGSGETLRTLINQVLERGPGAGGRGPGIAPPAAVAPIACGKCELAMEHRETVADLIRAALREKARNVEELLAYLHKHGKSTASKQTVYGVAWNLRKAGEITQNDETGIYAIA